MSRCSARDRGRFADARKRLNESPLGAAALAGTSFPIDRDMTAKALGFDRPTANSLDAVVRPRLRARDAVGRGDLRACICRASPRRSCSGRSPQFGFVRLSDKFTTGSSIMPQKRNPDAAELVRAKTGRIIGALHGAARGDEGPAARLLEGHAGGQGRRVRRALDALTLCARRDGRHGARHGARRRRACEGGGRRGYSTATDLADWLVRTLKLPFREAHHVTGRIVAGGREAGVPLEKLPLAIMQAIEPRITKAVFGVLSVEQSVESRTVYGGTAPRERARAGQALAQAAAKSCRKRAGKGFATNCRLG